MAKVYITMKTPDAVSQAAEDMDEEERELFEKMASKWFSYGETIILCINTDDETCTVEPS